MIISGANSKRQPELATFTEVICKDSIHIPVSSILQMNGNPDSLALGYNTFLALLEVSKPSEKQLKFRFSTIYKWGDAVSGMNLQLVLKNGQAIETGSGKKITLGAEKIEFGDRELGGLIRHNGWTLHIPPGRRFTWPVYPFNPYRSKPETELALAIGTLSVPLQPENQEFRFILNVD